MGKTKSCKCKMCDRDYTYRKGSGHTYTYCNSCSNRRTRLKRKKERLIYKGNKCVKCGYDHCDSALDFHHINEEEKEFGLSYNSTRAWSKEKKELDKCVILCANCHREFHAGWFSINDYLDKNPTPEEGERMLEEAGATPGNQKKKKNYCDDCGAEISQSATVCVSCNGKRSQKINWPPADKLAKMIKESSYLAVARQLGVSDNSVRKRIKYHSDINPKSLT